MYLSFIARKFLSLLKTKKRHSKNDLKRKKLSHYSNMMNNLLDYSEPKCSETESMGSNEITSVYDHPDFTAVIEIIKDKFYFATLIPGKRDPKQLRNMYIFNIDPEMVYCNFYDDFGPLNIACLYKYCHGINKILKNPEHQFIKIVHLTSMNPDKRANAAYLVASYSILYLKKEPYDVYESITSKKLPQLKPFRDVSMGASQYDITIIGRFFVIINFLDIEAIINDLIHIYHSNWNVRIDCLNALCKAVSLGFFNFDDFDVKEYEKCEKKNRTDMHWILPQKFLAFPGPSTEPNSSAHYPEKYLNYFMKNEVSTVIRLNRKAYEPFRFTNAGILHYDMFFPDGSVPPKTILKEFLQVAENTKGAIAVHCKAGLGRTGTLIAAYIMKHYYITAREAIAWLRICRPGSVIGYQQAWLEDMEKYLWREGRRYRLKRYGNGNLVLHHKKGIYSFAAKSDRKVQFKKRSKE